MPFFVIHYIYGFYPTHPIYSRKSIKNAINHDTVCIGYNR